MKYGCLKTILGYFLYHLTSTMFWLQNIIIHRISYSLKGPPCIQSLFKHFLFNNFIQQILNFRPARNQVIFRNTHSLYYIKLSEPAILLSVYQKIQQLDKVKIFHLYGNRSLLDKQNNNYPVYCTFFRSLGEKCLQVQFSAPISLESAKFVKNCIKKINI